MFCATLFLCNGLSSGAGVHCFMDVGPSPQAGQGPLQLQPGVRTQEDVEERVQQSVEAGQAVAQAVGKEDGALQSTRLIGEEQGHKAVPAHQVVRPEHRDKVYGDDNQDTHNFVPFVIGKRWRSS